MRVAGTPVGIGEEKDGARGVGRPAEAPDGAHCPPVVNRYDSMELGEVVEQASG